MKHFIEPNSKARLLALSPKLKKKSRDKHSSLFWQSDNDEDESGLHNVDTTGQCYKTFYNRKLQLFIISKSVCLSQAFPV